MRGLAALWHELSGLFVADWRETLAVLICIVAAILAAPHVPGALAGFGLAVVVATIVVVGAVVAAARH